MMILLPVISLINSNSCPRVISAVPPSDEVKASDCSRCMSVRRGFAERGRRASSSSMMARKSRMDTTPVLLGSNWAKTRSKAATSSSEGSSGSLLCSFLSCLSACEEGDDEDEEEDEEEEALRTNSSLSLAIVECRRLKARHGSRVPVMGCSNG